MFRFNPRPWLTALAACLLILPNSATACPFCSAVALTFSEEMKANDVAVIAKLVGPETKTRPATSPGGGGFRQDDISYSLFDIEQVLKGSDGLDGAKRVRVLYFGKQPPGSKFLLMGTDPEDVKWSTPIPLTDRAVAYMLKLPGLPEKGVDRLTFFQNYLEDKDDLLARDAYDEFAAAPYSEIKSLKSRMNHKQLVAWIKDPDLASSRRRLYLTMLGACGGREDAAMLEKMLVAKNDQPRTGLDAMIACYLTLKGPKGMPLIEDLFLRNDKAEYTDTYAAIMALRFHGQEETIIPRKRLLEGLRLMLDRPELADLVIPDLARWEDWAVMDRLAKLFKEADEKSSWVRVPVVQYLKACPLPKAEKLIAELEQIDPESVKRASFFLPLGGGAPKKKPAPAPAPATAEPKATKAADSTNSTKSTKTSAAESRPGGAATTLVSRDTAPQAGRRSTLPFVLGLGGGAFLLCLGAIRSKRGSRAAG